MSPDAKPSSDGPVIRRPLSFNQEFLCGFDRGDEEGPFGPRFHIVHGWRLRGKVDVETLQLALDDVVVRHEALRTAIVRGEGERHQEIHPAAPVRLELRELAGADSAARDRAVEELITEVESGTISARRLPLIQGTLLRFDEEDAVLALVVHHTAADGWSVRLIIRDLAVRYAERRGHRQPELPTALPYREFAAWQREFAADPALEGARAFWRKQLAGARILSVPTDRPKSTGLPESTAVHRFTVDAELTARAVEIAQALRSTPFMVLLGAFAVMVARDTGNPDVVVPTFSPGRGEDRFHHTVGPFFNFLPLRTDLSGARDFAEVVTRIRTTSLEAYAHDIPFGQILAQAPELMLPTLEDGRAACVFQVFPFPFLLDAELIGDLEYTEVRRRLTSQPVGSDVPNGALWTLNLDPAGDVVAGIQYNSNLYDERSVAEQVDRFRAVLRELVGAPDAPLELRPERS
ncbi:condensation domain-containing protein [Streptomyces sp. 1114.5]|uniref:condensation domain-containing protein n=1 Tax=Streptomyces sp. 1114.5 TaxID=1938830 RepID=UPI000F0F166C|nr:condensation domain-containing protein [Streptomyces sp. 1114.5]RKT19430.1 condensation domain-containing protein [Streptomyces sp. 1114.5]